MKDDSVFMPFRGQESILVPLRVFSLERFTVGTFTVPFMVLEPIEHKNVTGDNGTFQN